MPVRLHIGQEDRASDVRPTFGTAVLGISYLVRFAIWLSKARLIDHFPYDVVDIDRERVAIGEGLPLCNRRPDNP